MKKFLPILLTVMALQGCTNDLEYKAASAPEELVVSAQLNSSDRTHTVFTYVSSGTALKPAPEDVTVTCLVNGSEAARGVREEVEINVSEGRRERDATGDRSGEQRFFQGAFTFDLGFSPGDEVTIVAGGGGFSASGTTRFPEAPVIASVDTATVTIQRFWELDKVRKLFRVDVAVEDRPGQDDWFILEAILIQEAVLHREGKEDEPLSKTTVLKIDAGDDKILGEGIILTNEEVLGTLSSNTYNIFRDAFFKDGTGRISFTLNPEELGPNGIISLPEGAAQNYDTAYISSSLEIRVCGISQEEYNYLRALGIQAMTFYNSNFIEPMSIPDNIEGGTGFVGALSASKRAFRLPDTTIEFSLQ